MTLCLCWPARGGAGLPVGWLQAGERQKGWVGYSPGRSWNQSAGRTDGSDPFQQEQGPRPCPAGLNLEESREKKKKKKSTFSLHVMMANWIFVISDTFKLTLISVFVILMLRILIIQT